MPSGRSAARSCGASRRSRRSRCRPGRRRRRPPPSAPPTPTPSRGRSGWQTCRAPTPRRRWSAPSTPTSASSEAGSPASGPRCTRRRDDPARDVVLLEGETCGFGASGRNGGFAISSLTHGLENGVARFPDEARELERLGLENFDGLVADLARLGIDCDLEQTGDISVVLRPRRHGRARGRGGTLSALTATMSRCSTPRRCAPRSRRPSTTAASGIAPGSALVHPGKLALGLRRAALAPGCGCTSTRPRATCASGATASSS